MKFYFYIITIVFLLGLLFFLFFPKFTESSYLYKTYTINKKFNYIRNAFISGKFEKEVSEINNLHYTKKEWKNSDFNISKPLRRIREWEFSGTLFAEAVADNQKLALRQDVVINKNFIDITIKLSKPMNVGVTNMIQKIRLEPVGDSTKVFIEIKIDLDRRVPIWYKEKAKNILDNAANKIASSYEEALDNLPNSNISIPLKY